MRGFQASGFQDSGYQTQSNVAFGGGDGKPLHHRRPPPPEPIPAIAYPGRIYHPLISPYPTRPLPPVEAAPSEDAHEPGTAPDANTVVTEPDSLPTEIERQAVISRLRRELQAARNAQADADAATRIAAIRRELDAAVRKQRVEAARAELVRQAIEQAAMTRRVRDQQNEDAFFLLFLAA